MISSLWIICLFTFVIHFTESCVYSMRLAGIRTRQLAISLSFITSALLVSRLSNMGQAPLLGTMVDDVVRLNSVDALRFLESQFRVVILVAFFGSLAGALFTPTMVVWLQKGIRRFHKSGSLAGTVLSAFRPKHMKQLILGVRLPRWGTLKTISLKTLPKNFLIMNIFVTAIYTIGVLCALLAGAHLPELRSTAIQLSGIVNGVATILFAIIVDPSGARITDQAYHGDRPESDVKSVVFYLLLTRLIGTLIVAQVLFFPFAKYIMIVTEFIATHFA
ncbi:DUF2837 family protein [bacterium]|jgi:hypothetical protein|nr:DUF2837 family protein [bacterium]